MKLKITEDYQVELTPELKSEAMKKAWSYYPSLKAAEIEELKSRCKPEDRHKYTFGVDKEEVFGRCLKRAYNQIKARYRSRLGLMPSEAREGSKTEQIRAMLIEGKNPHQIKDILELSTVQFVYNQRLILKKKGVLR